MTERSQSTARIGVIGAGIVGLSVARRLLQVMDVEVTVIDKESTVVAHQTSHNSNVVHSGVYYPPGSLKAKLCRRGGELLRAYCAEWELPYEEVGKVIVALRDEELPQLFELADRAKANGIVGSRVIDTSELRDREPHVRGLSALLIPETAVVDFRIIAEQFAADVVRTGGEVILGHPVTEIQAETGTVRVATHAHEWIFDHVVVCAGLQSSQLARMVGAPPDPEIIPFRGETTRLPRDPLISSAVSSIRSQIPVIRSSASTSREALTAMSMSGPTLCWPSHRRGIGGATSGFETFGAQSDIRERASWHVSTGEWELAKYAVQSVRHSSCAAPVPMCLI